jgi:predicted nucleic acid-binding protein
MPFSTKEVISFFNLRLFSFPTQSLLETEWVLRFSYKRQSHEIRTAFKNLFGLPNVHLSNARLTEQVLQWHERGLDFADAFHLAQCQLCSDFYTFDAKFVDGAKELSSCRVQYTTVVDRSLAG